MNSEVNAALNHLAQLGVEYAGVLRKEQPAVAQAVIASVHLAHRTVTAELPKPPAEEVDNVVADA